MNRKIIFLDIDGTLTEPGKNVPPESALKAIKSAREKGHAVFLCTGRNYDMMKPLLAYDFDGFIASSGGYVQCGDEVIYDCPMTEEQRVLALEVFERNGVFRTVECNEGSYTDEGFKNFLRENAEKLLNNNTGLYRDKDGYCRSCTDKSSYYTSQSQCDICPNRRYNNNQCIYGLCEERLQFLNIGNSCVSCSGKNIAVNPKKANLCDSCENRRMLTTGFEEQDNWAGLCVEECTGFHWQDINGNCLACSASDNREIGTDVESRRLCNECEGLRESQPIYGGTDGTEITGYRCVLK